MKNTTRESTSTFSPNILESLLNSNYRNMVKPETSINLSRTSFIVLGSFLKRSKPLQRKTSDMKYIDSIVHFCEKNNVDIESVPKLLSKP